MIWEVDAIYKVLSLCYVQKKHQGKEVTRTRRVCGIRQYKKKQKKKLERASGLDFSNVHKIENRENWKYLVSARVEI